MDSELYTIQKGHIAGFRILYAIKHFYSSCVMFCVLSTSVPDLTEVFLELAE